MKQFGHKLFAGLVFTAISFGVTACQQAPAPVSAAPADAPAPVAAPAPAPTQVVVERPVVVEDRRPQVVEERPGVGVNVDIHKHDDRGHVSVDLHARP